MFSVVCLWRFEDNFLGISFIYMAQDQTQILRFGGECLHLPKPFDGLLLFLFIYLFIWEKVSDSVELCSRGWSQILDSPDPPSTGITEVCQHTWIRVKFYCSFFVCLEENEPRCFCFIVVHFYIWSSLWHPWPVKFVSPTQLQSTTLLGFSPGQFCPKLTSTLLGLYSSQHKEPLPTWHTQAHYNCILAYKGVLWHLFKVLKALWILHVMLLSHLQHL